VSAEQSRTVHGRAAALGVVFTVALSACTPAPPPPPPPEPDWQGLLESLIERGSPAASMAVTAGGRELWAGAAGLAHIQGAEAATPEHAFHLASITKLFTAVAALALVDAGRLSPNDRIARLLPADRLSGLPYADEINVKQLLDHTSGVYPTNNDPDYLRALVGNEAGAAAEWTATDFVRVAATREPRGRPGGGTSYGDTGYILLGLVVEAVTGEALREHVTRTLLEPIGMESAYYWSTVEPGAEPPPGTVHGYLVRSEELLSILDESRFESVDDRLLDTTSAGERIDAAAALIATARDLARFGSVLYGGKVLSPTTAAMLRASAQGLENAPVGAERQGIVRSYNTSQGVLLTSQGDGPGGSTTLLAHHPASGLTIAVLLNVFSTGDEADFLLHHVVPEVIAGYFHG
jgi:D-alanyl-D-alanine carboxypeptidase